MKIIPKMCVSLRYFPMFFGKNKKSPKNYREKKKFFFFKTIFLGKKFSFKVLGPKLKKKNLVLIFLIIFVILLVY